MSAKDYPASDELAELRRRLRALEEQVDQFRRVRVPTPASPLQVRWCVTTAGGDAWPTGSANVFPIRFLDPDFTATQGLRNFNRVPRSANSAAYAFSHRDWVPEGVPLLAVHQRGLGAADAGEWWLLETPDHYLARLLGSLAAGLSASAEIYLRNSSRDLVASGCTVTVYDEFLPAGETLEADTLVSIEWEPFRAVETGVPAAAPYGDWLARTAGCSPREWV